MRLTYGNKGILPELKVIADGALKGFVSVNPRWAAFKAEDYQTASASVYEKITETYVESIEIEAKSGEFDLRGFEIARSQFFDTARKICVTFSTDYFQFSTECVRKLEKAIYIEMLVHPHEHLLAARRCTKETRNAIRWALVDDGQYYPRNISCAAYIETLYKIFGWNLGCRYRVRGLHRQKDQEAVIIFDVRETEMFIPQSVLDSRQDDNPKDDLLPGDVRPFTVGQKKDIMAYPTAWADSFGSNFYRHAQARELATVNREGAWKINEEGQPFGDSLALNVTTTEVISNEIKQMIYDMKQEECTDGE